MINPFRDSLQSHRHLEKFNTLSIVQEHPPSIVRTLKMPNDACKIDI